MKKISIYCFILISLGFIGCTSKTHEKTIEDFDIREMSLQVDTLYSRMTQAERVAQLYGIRPKEIMEDGKLSLEKCREKIPDGIGHICQYACALDMEPNELRDFVRDLQNYLIHETPSGIPAIFHEEAITGLAAKGATVYPQQLGIACTWNPELATVKTEQTAEVMRSVGATLALSPMVDLIRTAHWPRIEESYGEDGYLSTDRKLYATGNLDLDCPEYRKTSYDLACQSIVLLKNNNVLPLSGKYNENLWNNLEKREK